MTRSQIFFFFLNYNFLLNFKYFINEREQFVYYQQIWGEIEVYPIVKRGENALCPKKLIGHYNELPCISSFFLDVYIVHSTYHKITSHRLLQNYI